MQEEFSALQCSCECGANRFALSAPPVARFICHCNICKNYTQKDFSDVTVVAAKHVVLSDIAHTEFKRYKGFPSLRRGKCRQCDKPSLEFFLFDSLAFIPASTYREPQRLPAPSMHIFYDLRAQDIADDLPKHCGFMRSQLMATTQILKGQLG